MHEDVCVSIWREEGEGVQDKNSNKRIAKFDLKPVFSKVSKLISLEAQKFACFTKRSALLQQTAPICIFLGYSSSSHVGVGERLRVHAFKSACMNTANQQ